MRNKNLFVVLLLVLSICLLSAEQITLPRNTTDRPKGLVNPSHSVTLAPDRDNLLISSNPIYTETFEPLPASWTVGAGWNIGLDPTLGAHSQPYSAYTNHPYDAYADYQLLSPVIPIPAAPQSGTEYILSYWSWWETESGYDYLYVDVIEDGALHSTVFNQNGYSDWQEVNINISQYAGHNIQLRFRFTSDGSGQYSGCAIDNLSIIQNIYEITPELNLLSLNTQNFPFIYSTLSVALEGEDMSNLNASNFAVSENGVLQTNYFEVIPPSQGAGSRLVDIAFLMDNSGSMSSSQSAVSANVTDFINNLSSSGVDCALGLCRYGSSVYGGDPFLEDSGILTTNLPYFRDNVWPRNDISGGYEPGYYAMTYALANFNWRPGAQKVLIIITDEYPDQGGASQSDALNACTDNGAILFALTESDLYDYYTSITQATGGEVFNIYNNFDIILNAISQIIVSNYIISYRSSDPFFNGIERNLEFVLNYQGLSATALGSYFPGETPQIVRTPATVALDTTPQIDNQDLPIQATITDNFAPFTTGATLFYQILGQQSWITQAMTNLGGDLWAGIIPAAAAQTPGVGYYISATDGQSTATLPSLEPNNNPFTIAILPNIPPEIIHYPASQVQNFSALPVAATIFDNTTYIESVQLFYRRYGQLTFTSVVMQNNGDNQYLAVIPGDVIGSYGVEYFIRAIDNYGMTGNSGFADNPHFVPALLNGVVIPGGPLTNFHWTAAESPYYINGTISVDPDHVLVIEPGTTIIFQPYTCLEIYGGLLANGATFTANDPILGWLGIYLESSSPQIDINNCNIQNAHRGVTFNNSSGILQYSRITKDYPYPNEVGIEVQGVSNPQINNNLILGYACGIAFNNEDLRTTSSPSLTNTRIRNTSNSVRPVSRGIEVTGAVGLAIHSAEIEEFDEGIYWDGQGTTAYLSTPSLGNVRIRNTTNSIRTASTGLKLINIGAVNLVNDSIVGYPLGLEIVNNNLNRVASSASLSNIRIRNTTNSIRSTGTGCSLTGNILATISDLEIDDYDTGFSFIADSTAVRTTSSASLSNIRIRNTTSSLRTATTGMNLRGSLVATLDTLEIDNYTTGLYYEGDGQAFNRTTPSLSNIRIRNTTSSVREPVAGIVLKNLSAVTLQDNIIYPNLTDDPGNASGNGIKLEAVHNAQMQQNTIWGYNNGLQLQNSNNASFTNNVIWTNAEELNNPIEINNSNVAVTNNCISFTGSVYPGENLDKDPQFANPLAGNFYLKPRSPLRDTGIGALGFVFEALATEIHYTMHPNWNLMGVPCLTNIGDDTPVAIFADYLNPFYVAPTYTSIVQLNPAAVSDSLGHLSLSYSGSYNTPQRVVPGRGYWVRNPYANPAPVDVYGILDDGDYRIELAGALGPNNGWYMLANPYDRPISFTYDSISIAPGSMIAEWAYAYDYVHNEYILVDDDQYQGFIAPWSGFFIKANGPNDQLLLSYPQDASRSQVIALQKASPNPPTTDPVKIWELTLKAVADESTDAVLMGIAAHASPEYDPQDVPELPEAPFTMTGGLNLSIVNNDWETSPGAYTRDIRAKNQQSWTWNLLLNVENLLVDGKLQQSISLERDLSARLPEGYRFALNVPSTGQSCDLSSAGLVLELDIDANQGGSPWLIPIVLEVNRTGENQEESERSLLSCSNYPNPFNPETTIRYSLGCESPVSLEIFNIKGQLVKSLVNTTQKAGEHSAVWKGTDNSGREVASGFYFYRISAGKETVLKKILLMK